MIKKFLSVRFLLVLGLLIFDFAYFRSQAESLKPIVLVFTYLIQAILLVALGTEMHRILVVLKNRPLLRIIHNNAGFNLPLSNPILFTPIGQRVLIPLVQLAQNSSKLDYKNLITLEFNQYALRNAFSRVVISTMVILGLLGTLYGMRDAVEPLDIGLRDPQIPYEKLRKIIADSFNGISTTFITSILGIMGSVIIGLMNSWSNSLIHHIQIQVERYIQVEVLPVLQVQYPSSEIKLFDRIGMLGDKLESLFENKIHELVSSVEANTTSTARHLQEVQKQFFSQLTLSQKAFDENLSQQYTDYTKALHSGFLYLENQFANYLEQFFKRLADENVNLIEKNKEKNLEILELVKEKTTDVFNLLEGKTQQTTEYIHSSLTEITPKFTELLNLQQDTIGGVLKTKGEAIITQLSTTLTEQFERQANIVSNLEKNREILEEKSRDILNAMESKLNLLHTENVEFYSLFQQKLHENYALTTKEIEHQRKSQTETAKFVETLLTTMQKSVDLLEQAVKKQDKAQQQQQQYWLELFESFEEQIKQAFVRYNSIQAQQENWISKALQQTENLYTMANKAEDLIEKLGQTTEELSKTIYKEVESVGSQFKELMDAAGNRLENFTEQYEGIQRKQEEWFSIASNHIGILEITSKTINELLNEWQGGNQYLTQTLQAQINTIGQKALGLVETMNKLFNQTETNNTKRQLEQDLWMEKANQQLTEMNRVVEVIHETVKDIQGKSIGLWDTLPKLALDAESFITQLSQTLKELTQQLNTQSQSSKDAIKQDHLAVYLDQKPKSKNKVKATNPDEGGSLQSSTDDISL